jgi:hypothetical protein
MRTIQVITDLNLPIRFIKYPRGRIRNEGKNQKSSNCSKDSNRFRFSVIPWGTMRYRRRTAGNNSYRRGINKLEQIKVLVIF